MGQHVHFLCTRDRVQPPLGCSHCGLMCHSAYTFYRDPQAEEEGVIRKFKVCILMVSIAYHLNM